MIQFFTKKLNNRKGFTLVELLIVIAILGIMAGIAIPRLTGITDTVREQADQTSGEALVRDVQAGILTGQIEIDAVGTDWSFVATGTGEYFADAFPAAQSQNGVLRPQIQRATANSNTINIRVVATTGTSDTIIQESSADVEFATGVAEAINQ